MEITALIISTTRSRAPLLRYAISSVINQSRKPNELIVVMSYDDREIRELVDPYGFVVHHVSTRVGPMWARGIKESSGDVVAFLDDDDEWLQNKLNHVEEVFGKITGLGLYHNLFQFIDTNGNELNCDDLPAYYCSMILNRRAVIKNSIDLYMRSKVDDWLHADYWSLFYNTSSLSAIRDALIGRLDFIESINLYSDAIFFILVLSQCYTVVHEPIILTRYRIHGGQTSRKILNGELMDMAAKDHELFNRIIREHNTCK
ncbi:glycosyltransferase family 2 protein [Vulcanisaeta sp. JCM 14467]|uniref:glycosyltransferase family 2 protein n=1 Tax=Vulcanisaeta sp. JCM 14467 TaxID=1295370 RepID=UPI0006D17998|nr:glycosyltransferase family 2 protein [Vulcanisaeta sp. JCM 14467]